MSLGIIIKGPEGLVLAAESRVTISSPQPAGGAIHVNYDNATKVLSFGTPHNYVGVVTYGLASIGLRTAHSYIPEFESQLPTARISVEDFAKQLSNFFKAQWDVEMPAGYAGPAMVFHVAGFNDGNPYGEIYTFDIPSNPVPKRADSDKKGEFHIGWGGQREFVDRLLQGYDNGLVSTLRGADFQLTPDQTQKLNDRLRTLQMQIPLQAMALQDCVDLATFFIRTTISAQKLTVGIRGCGGEMDVAIITRREGLQFVHRKSVRIT